MKILVDEMPCYGTDCIFYNCATECCNITGYSCEILDFINEQKLKNKEYEQKYHIKEIKCSMLKEENI